MKTQELKQELKRIITELGKEGIEVEVEGVFFLRAIGERTVAHTVTFKEKDQC